MTRGRVGLLALAVVVLLIAPAVTASASLPQTSAPTLHLARTIRTTPFIDTTVSMRDAEGSAYVPRDNSLWLIHDGKNGAAYEVDPRTGALKQVIGNSAFQSAPRLGGGPAAGSDRTGDLEAVTYDEARDIVYAFSGNCCTSSALPTAFRLLRNGNGVFQPESYQPLATGSDFPGAAWNSGDGKLYVGKGSNLRVYDYDTNTIGPTFKVPDLSGILGMGFAPASDGNDLLVVTGAQKLYRVDWASKTIKPGWSFDLTPFGVLDSRAVELISDQFYVLDGKNRPSGDPLKYAVFVLDVRAPSTAPTASFTASPPSGAAPLTVTFTDTSSGDPTSWWWDLGDGTTSTLQNPSHVYGSPGTYSVTLTASNSFGTSSAQTSIIVNGSLTVAPAADSYVKSNYPKTNYGTATGLKGKLSDAEYRPYLTFSVQNVATMPASAKLRLFVTNGSVSAGDWYMVSTNWTETGIIWNNAPPIDGQPFATPGSAKLGTWLEIDVTSIVTGNGVYAFAMKTQSSDTVEFSSKEGANPPQLVLTMPAT